MSAAPKRMLIDHEKTIKALKRAGHGIRNNPAFQISCKVNSCAPATHVLYSATIEAPIAQSAFHERYFRSQLQHQNIFSDTSPDTRPSNSWSELAEARILRLAALQPATTAAYQQTRHNRAHILLSFDYPHTTLKIFFFFFFLSM